MNARTRWPNASIPRERVKPRRRVPDFAAAYGDHHPRGLPIVPTLSKLREKSGSGK